MRLGGVLAYRRILMGLALSQLQQPSDRLKAKELNEIALLELGTQ